jgi:hypothetical protein
MAGDVESPRGAVAVGVRDCRASGRNRLHARGLDAKHWMSLGITLGVASVFIVGTALYRLIVYGRA